MIKKIALTIAGLLMVSSPILVAAQAVGASDTCSSSPTVQCLQGEIEQLIQILTQLLAARHQPTQPTNQPSAAIDQSSLVANATTASLSGSASGTTAVEVFILPSSYNGPVDLEGISKGNSNILRNSVAYVINGRWSDLINAFPVSIAPALPAATYTVLIYDDTNTGADSQPLATGTLTVGSGSNPSTGSLTVSLNQQFNGSTVSPGTPDVAMASFDLDASQSNEDVRISSIPLNLGNGAVVANGPSGPSGSISDCQMYDGTTPLNTGANVLIPSSVSGANYTLTFDNALTIPKGNIIQLTLTCNISSSAAGQYSWNLDASQQLSAVGVADGQAIPTTMVAGGTHSITIGSGAALTAFNPTPLSYNIVAGGTGGVTVGSFTLQPSGDNVNLQRIVLDLAAQSASPSDIMSASIWEGATQVGTVNFNGAPTGVCPPNLTGSLGSCYFATSTISSLTLPQNAQTNFTIKANIANIGAGQSGTPGDDIIVSLADAQGVDASSGAVVHSGPAAAPTGTGFRIFKSYPTVAQIPFSSTGLADGATALRFSVTAASNGSVGIGKLAFNTAENNAGIVGLTLRAYSDPNYSIPLSGFSTGVLATTPNFTSGPTTIATLPQPVEIGAGQTVYFQLSLGLTGIGTNASITTTLLGDSSFSSLGTQNSVAGNFVWSPNDKTVSQSSNLDWTNSFGVSGLPSSGITQIITGTGSAPTPTPTPTDTSYSCTNTSGTQVKLSWSDADQSVTAYNLNVSGGPTPLSIAVQATPGVVSQLVTINAGTAYQWDVSAMNSVGTSPHTVTAGFTCQNTVPPATPSGLSSSCVAGSNGTQAKLMWNDSDTSITAYNLNISGGASPSSQAVTAAGSAMSKVVNVTPGTTYQWDVSAVNPAGTSGLSQTLSFTCQPTSPPSAAPTIISSSCNGSQATFTWSDPDPTVTVYSFNMSSAGGASSKAVPNTGNGTVTYSTSVTPGVAYEWDVSAFNAVGGGPLSPTPGFTCSASSAMANSSTQTAAAIESIKSILLQIENDLANI